MAFSYAVGKVSSQTVGLDNSRIKRWGPGKIWSWGDNSGIGGGDGGQKYKDGLEKKL